MIGSLALFSPFFSTCWLELSIRVVHQVFNIDLDSFSSLPFIILIMPKVFRKAVKYLFMEFPGGSVS